VTRLEGKFKLSQNRAAADREGVVQGLSAQGDAVLATAVREGK
jgi:transcriptional regulator